MEIARCIVVTRLQLHEAASRGTFICVAPHGSFLWQCRDTSRMPSVGLVVGLSTEMPPQAIRLLRLVPSWVFHSSAGML